MWELRVIAMTLSLGVAGLMLAGKLAAFSLTGSNAILADAAESVVHVLASGVAALSLWYSRQAPDRQHPYGHGKIAYFSAGFEGALIGTAALAIFYTSFHSLLFGIQLTELRLGLLITAALAGVNLFLGLFLVYAGKRSHSLVLTANGRHVLTDMWSSVGVVLGVGAVWLTGLEWLDPAVAIAVGVNILYAAWRLIREAFEGLLDKADPANTALLLKCLQACVDHGDIDGFHQLRHRETEDILWIDMHLLVPSDMPTGEAHDQASRVEGAVRKLFPDKRVNIVSHVEPATHIQAHPDGHTGMTDPLDRETH